MERKVILASGSPRRRELLAKIIENFEVVTSDCDETLTDNPSIDMAVLQLSARKAEAVSQMLLKKDPSVNAVIIGADTAVGLARQHSPKGSYDILGKPKDEEEAAQMLRRLSGREHLVCTGVSLYVTGNGKAVRKDCIVSHTRVCFHEMTEWEIQEYIRTGEPMDKAGAYGIQGAAAKYIDWINGDYYNVVGLPVSALYRSLMPLLHARFL